MKQCHTARIIPHRSLQWQPLHMYWCRQDLQAATGRQHCTKISPSANHRHFDGGLANHLRVGRGEAQQSLGCVLESCQCSSDNVNVLFFATTGFWDVISVSLQPTASRHTWQYSADPTRAACKSRGRERQISRETKFGCIIELGWNSPHEAKKEKKN